MSTKPPHSQGFKIEVERRQNATLVRLVGACDMNQSDKLTAELLNLAAQAPKLIVLDLAMLDFIESSGLGGIVAGYLRLRRREGELRVAGARPAIGQLLELTRLTQLFKVYENVEQALA